MYPRRAFDGRRDGFAARIIEAGEHGTEHKAARFKLNHVAHETGLFGVRSEEPQLLDRLGLRFFIIAISTANRLTLIAASTTLAL